MNTVTVVRLLFSVALAITSICTAVWAGSREFYMYDDLGSGESIVINPSMEALGVGESTFEARYCGSDSEFVCFESHPYAFAVRKRGSCDLQSWKVDGRTYVVTKPLHQRYLVGKIQEVCVIESSITRGGESVSGRYLYSPVEGLLLMEFNVGKGAESYHRIYLARAKGFAAAAK